MIPVSELADHRAELLDAMVTLYGGERETHARALLSQWTKYYFGFAATAGFVAAALLRRPLAMSPDKTHIVLRDGLPIAAYFEHDALQPVECDPARRYAPLVEHLQRGDRDAVRDDQNRTARLVEQRGQSAGLPVRTMRAAIRSDRRHRVALRSDRCRRRGQSAASAGAPGQTARREFAESVQRTARVLRTL